MPDPHIYPEPPNPPLLLNAAAGDPAPTFAPIEQLAAPDPDTPEIAKTMFIRVAVSGPACLSVISPTAPSFYLRADRGDAVLINDHAQQPNQTYPIFHKSGGSFLDFVADGSVFLEDDNVFRLEITFSDAAGEYEWRLGFWNNDAANARLFTWVVSGALSKTAQQWIDVPPTALSFDFDAGDGQTQQKNLVISNRGTGALVVTDILPALDGPYSVAAAFPLSVRPNASPPATLTIGFASPKEPADVPVTSRTVVTGNDPGPFVAGHNNLFSLSAHARQRPPVFVASQQFKPRGGRAGKQVKLFGQNFDVGHVTVRFGQLAATIVQASANQITAVVPDAPPNTIVKLTVQTDAGAVTSDDKFLVLPFPSVEKVDPTGGHAGDQIAISGRNLILGGETVSVVFDYEEEGPFGEQGHFVMHLSATSSTEIVVLVPEISSHHDHVEGTLTVFWRDDEQTWSWVMPDQFFVAIL